MAIGTHTGKILDGRYKLLQPLGKGGMGEVYLGKHIAIGKTVAVKLLRSIFADEKAIVQRFYREAQAASAIKHPNIIDVLDVGLSEWGDPFIVMEYLEGESLGDLLARRGPLGLAAACGVMEPALKALDAAHRVGVIHRDLKPDNIFLLRGAEGGPRVKIIDFGISKFTGAEGYTKLTQDGSLLGTPSYMSPEQARGLHNIDGRADVFAMGVILYEILSGTLPFEGDNYNSILISVLTDDPRDPSIANPEFPVEAWPIVVRALAKNAKTRYESTLSMLHDLGGLESFASRGAALAHLARGLSRPSFAIGDLGHSTTTLELSDSSLEELASASSNERTPESWEEGTRPHRTQRKRRIPFAIAAAMGFLTLIFLAVSMGPGFFEEKQEAPTIRTAAEEEPQFAERDEAQGALITVVGMPSEAKLFFDDVIVPMNPFRTDRRDTIVTLRVEADGFEPFSIAVEPSTDRTVQVELEPAKKERVSGMARPKTARRSGKEEGGGGPEKETVSNAALARQRADEVYNAKKGQLVECYNKALSLKEVPPEKTVLTKLRVRIRSTGVVDEVSVGGAGGSYSGLSSCLEKTVKTWVFPPAREDVTETFPINFTTR